MDIFCGHAKCRDLCVAHKLFEEMPHSGYVDCGNSEIVWEILRTMKRYGFDFDEYTFGSILMGVACAYRLNHFILRVLMMI